MHPQCVESVNSAARSAASGTPLGLKIPPSGVCEYTHSASRVVTIQHSLLCQDTQLGFKITAVAVCEYTRSVSRVVTVQQLSAVSGHTIGSQDPTLWRVNTPTVCRKW